MRGISICNLFLACPRKRFMTDFRKRKWRAGNEDAEARARALKKRFSRVSQEFESNGIVAGDVSRHHTQAIWYHVRGLLLRYVKG